jgi:hypothetical protein
MPFFRKSEKSEERVNAVESRLREVREEIDSLEKKISRKKEEVAENIGLAALEPGKAEYQNNLQSSRKALNKLKESHIELHEQRLFLMKELGSLNQELQKARLRDLPGEMEKRIAEFNATLEETMNALETLEALHGKLNEANSKFRQLSIERDNALSTLKEVGGLDLPQGFGKLSRVPSPHRFDFTVPDRFGGVFLDQLLMYRQKVREYVEFQEKNPDFEQNVRRTRERDAQSSATPGRFTRPKSWQL